MCVSKMPVLIEAFLLYLPDRDVWISSLLFRFLDRHSFATCSDDCAVNLWDLRNLSTRVRQLVGHTKWVKNIEFEESRHSLLTSGFDGSVFRWDLDEYPQGETPKKVLAFQGLMRMKLAPQTDKMVLSTMNGYIIVVHDLDLDTVAVSITRPFTLQL